MTPNELREAITKAIDTVVVEEKQTLVKFEGIYKDYTLVRSCIDAVSVYYTNSHRINHKLAVFSTKEMGRGKLEYLIYETITIKDFGGSL